MPKVSLACRCVGIGLLLTLGACATITQGMNESIEVTTEPAGAHCTLRRDGDVIARIAPTPGTATVSKSGHDIAVDCEMAGRAKGSAVISADFQAATLGNVLIGGLIGYAVDLGTGAASEYPHDVDLWLERLDGVPDPRFRLSAAHDSRYDPILPGEHYELPSPSQW